jgi:predicted Zn-dependent peptidase
VSGSQISCRHRDLEQTHLCLGLDGIPVTDSRRFVAALLNIVLGGNMSSRLFQVIREERGLAYSIYSFLTSYADTGMLGVYTAVAPEHAQTCIELILDHIRRLQDDPVPAEVIQGAKEFLKGNLLMAAESPDNQMVRLAQNEFYFDRYIPMQSIIEGIDAVTPEAIMALASNLWGGRRPSLTALGPHADRIDFTDQLAILT